MPGADGTALTAGSWLPIGRERLNGPELLIGLVVLSGWLWLPRLRRLGRRPRRNGGAAQGSTAAPADQGEK